MSDTKSDREHIVQNQYYKLINPDECEFENVLQRLYLPSSSSNDTSYLKRIPSAVIGRNQPKLSFQIPVGKVFNVKPRISDHFGRSFHLEITDSSFQIWMTALVSNGLSKRFYQNDEYRSFIENAEFRVRFELLGNVSVFTWT
jgi:hypothetical protein